MKMLLHKVLLICTFSIVLGHNFISHHHKNPLHSGQTHNREESDHHHHPFSFISVDEFFVGQTYDLQNFKTLDISFAAVPYTALAERDNRPSSGFAPAPKGHPPSPPLIRPFSPRGPPQI